MNCTPRQYRQAVRRGGRDAGARWILLQFAQSPAIRVAAATPEVLALMVATPSALLTHGGIALISTVHVASHS